MVVFLGSGEKLIICGVKGVHLVEFPEAVVVSRDDVEELAEGLPPSFSPSTINSVKHNILQPRLRASTPESFAASSEEAVDELGDVARVLATEPWLALPGRCSGIAPNDATDCGCGATVVNAGTERCEASPTGFLVCAVGVVENMAIFKKLC